MLKHQGRVQCFRGGVVALAHARATWHPMCGDIRGAGPDGSNSITHVAWFGETHKGGRIRRLGGAWLMAQGSQSVHSMVVVYTS
jgi:hypothetical protein